MVRNAPWILQGSRKELLHLLRLDLELETESGDWLLVCAPNY